MSDQSKLCIGNILLYDHIRKKRNPVFLHRSLQRALREHEKELGDRETRPDSMARPQSRPQKRSWKWPSMDLIQGEAKKQAFVFRPLRFSSSPSENSALPGSATNQIRLLQTCEIQITVTIKETTEYFPCWRKTIGAQLQVWQCHNGNSLDIKMHQGNAFKVPLTDFALPNDPDDLSSPRYRIGTSYAVDIAFDTRREGNNIEKLFEYAGISDSELLTNPPTRWKASWNNVKHCPSTPFIPLQYPAGHGCLNSLGLGVQVRMGWTKTTKSALVTANRSHSPAATNQGMPQSRRSGRRFEVTYDILGNVIEGLGLVCPHCNAIAKFRRLQDLKMHFDSFHDLFKYEFRKVGEVEGLESWHCECTLSNHRADQRVGDRLDHDEVQVVAPTRPFDQRKYLEQGDDSWQREAKLEKVLRPPNSRHPTISAVARRDPADVQLRSRCSKKKYKVPKAPEGITFYRVYSKRPLKEGEYISESEDDVDMGWLRFKTEADIIRNPTIPSAAKRFLKVYNLYMRDEQVHSDVHFEEALIRFALEHGAWIREEGLVQEFATEVRELCEDGVITPMFRDACVDIVKHGSSREPARSVSATTKVDKGKGKVIRGTRARQPEDHDGDIAMTDATATPNSPSIPEFDRCLCGQQIAIRSTHEVIYCESDLCARHGFHVSCVTQHWNPIKTPHVLEGGWYCKDCSFDPDIDTGKKQWYGTDMR